VWEEKSSPWMDRGKGVFLKEVPQHISKGASGKCQARVLSATGKRKDDPGHGDAERSVVPFVLGNEAGSRGEVLLHSCPTGTGRL